MGSWSVYCGISNISITDGNECVLLPLKKNDGYHGYLPYLPATLPIFGEYNDYGDIENIKEDENTKLIEEHFGCEIQDFCNYITGNHDVDKSKFTNLKEFKKWKYMFIDKKVYDYMSKHINNEYGDYDYGNPALLKALGGQYIGIDKSIDRYNKIWKINNVEFNSDDTWLQCSGKPIYNYDPSLLFEVLSDDKKLLLKQHKYSLWNIYDDKYIAQHMFWIIGVDGSHYHLNHFLDEIEDKLDDEAYERIMGKKRNEKKKLLTIAEKYTDQIRTFGDYFADLLIMRENMHCFSQAFNPYVQYLTPQCGEYKDHQQILEKFAEINKSKFNDEDED